MEGGVFQLDELVHGKSKSPPTSVRQATGGGGSFLPVIHPREKQTGLGALRHGAGPRGNPRHRPSAPAGGGTGCGQVGGMGRTCERPARVGRVRETGEAIIDRTPAEKIPDATTPGICAMR